MLADHPQPPFALAGYVTADDPTPPSANGTGPPPRLGTQRQLRDLVRLNHIDDVVFAASSLSNRVIFRLIDELRDLPVQFRMLAEGREHVIGKASVDHLAVPALVEAEVALGSPRSPAARRAFDISLALLGLLSYPIVSGAARLGSPRMVVLRQRLRELPTVLAGQRTLVGRRPDAASDETASEVELPPAVFDVTDALAGQAPDPSDRRRIYSFYIRNQSASLDWSILMRALRTPADPGGA
jgi:hypothetical protein